MEFYFSTVGAFKNSDIILIDNQDVNFPFPVGSKVEYIDIKSGEWVSGIVMNDKIYPTYNYYKQYKDSLFITHLMKIKIRMIYT